MLRINNNIHQNNKIVKLGVLGVFKLSQVLTFVLKILTECLTESDELLVSEQDSINTLAMDTSTDVTDDETPSTIPEKKIDKQSDYNLEL